MAFIKNEGGSPTEDEKVIAMRSVGNKILLQNGDATSNLPPVKNLGEGVFQLRFASAFTFVPDSLVSIVNTAFRSAGIAGPYIVKVTDIKSGEMIYGYEIHTKPEPEIIPCLGRQQPVGLYNISIAFGDKASPAGITESYVFPSVGLLLSLFSIGLFMFKGKKSKPAIVVNDNAIRMGEYSFFAEQGLLKYKEVNIHLTVKELKLLTLLSQQPNTCIERQELIKHIWEDEGLIVGGRSLDVFVSRLRKKLNGDTSVNIVNVHGLGYKLEIDNAPS